MSRAATAGVITRAARDFRLAVRGGPFRVAFVLSLIAHVLLVVVFGRAGLWRAGGIEPKNPLMHVRLLPPEPLPATVHAAPTIKPPVRQARREKPGRPAAAVLPPLPAPTLPAPEATASTVAHVPELEPPPVMTVRGEAAERPASAETAQPPVADALPPVLSPGAAQISLAPEAAGPATGLASSVSVPAAAGSGSGGSTAAGTERGGHEAIGTAAAEAGAAGTITAAAATVSRREPGPRDLAAVRHRIDAHKVYPQIAVRNGWEGRVLVEMRLEGDGSLTTVRLLEGSGFAVLDDATIVAVRRASPFPPVARILTVPVEYRLVP